MKLIIYKKYINNKDKLKWKKLLRKQKIKKYKISFYNIRKLIFYFL